MPWLLNGHKVFGLPEFHKFSKIPRLSRDMIITEKIDGTNAQIYITEPGMRETILMEPPPKKGKDRSVSQTRRRIFAGSRNRWLIPEADNFGFAAWVEEHKDELIAGLGPGRHYGEWWGKGIQRNYGLDERRFSLFNVRRWHSACHIMPDRVLPPDVIRTIVPECCRVVPVLYAGSFNTAVCTGILDTLRETGSCAVPGFMDPEGIVICHVPSGYLFKKTFENDDGGKNNVAA